jgi:hypothetical protein
MVNSHFYFYDFWFYGFSKPDFPLLCEDSPALVSSPGEAEATTVDGGVCLEPQSHLTPEIITVDGFMTIQACTF